MNEAAQGYTQPQEFLEESEALYGVVADLREADFERATRFKQWTINQILTHLHLWNRAAEQVLTDEDAVVRLMSDFIALGNPELLRDYEQRQLGGLRGTALRQAWRAQFINTACSFAAVDPKRRTPWYGPPLSARSNITARLMETWAHGQAVYDLLALERGDTDRIRSVALLGVNTFEWSFKVRGLTVPEVRPWVDLRLPSSASLTWGEPSAIEVIRGSATEFCQVVTQVRNAADTGLQVLGATATRWMSIAQAFAGVPHPPPAPGTRFREPNADWRKAPGEKL